MEIYSELILKDSILRKLCESSSTIFTYTGLSSKIRRSSLFFSDSIFVSAMNERSSEIFLIELPKPKSLDVLKQFNNDYHYLVQFLDIKKNRLVILNPNKAKK